MARKRKPRADSSTPRMRLGPKGDKKAKPCSAFAKSGTSHRSQMEKITAFRRPGWECTNPRAPHRFRASSRFRPMAGALAVIDFDSARKAAIRYSGSGLDRRHRRSPGRLIIQSRLAPRRAIMARTPSRIRELWMFCYRSRGTRPMTTRDTEFWSCMTNFTAYLRTPFN